MRPIQYWLKCTFLLLTCWLIHALHWKMRYWADILSSWYRVNRWSISQHHAGIENTFRFSIQITSLFICCRIDKFDLPFCLDACVCSFNSKINGHCTRGSFPYYNGHGEIVLENWWNSWGCYCCLYWWGWSPK